MILWNSLLFHLKHALYLLLFYAPFLYAEKIKDKLVLAHYMPWYESKDVSGEWGWHWEMGKRFNPEKIDEKGRREIASHYYPLLGAYDSGDLDLLACHLQLMKLAGIDGVIIDWYGTRDFRGYGRIHEHTLMLIDHVEQAGLKFAICYEDRTISAMVKAGNLRKAQDVEHTREVFSWVSEEWFSSDHYVKVDGRPVLLNFGPFYFKKPDQWNEIFSRSAEKPHLYVLPHHTEMIKTPSYGSAFGWIPVHGGDETKPDEWRAYLENLYSRKDDHTLPMAVAFPEFKDVYEKSYGTLDRQEGRTFTETLKRAYESEAELIQLCTWNDFGESTVIEPTEELGYEYLEVLQGYKTKDFSYGKEDLRLPVRLYFLKKKHVDSPDVMETLEQASRALTEGLVEEASALMGTVPEA